jgi:fructose-specific phosphotransferase system IIA component
MFRSESNTQNEPTATSGRAKRTHRPGGIDDRLIATRHRAEYDFSLCNIDPTTTQQRRKPRGGSPVREMSLSEILKPANIQVPLAAASKSDAIRELVDLLAKNGDVTDAQKVLEAVLEREATRTTGIGNGMAIPHGKCTGTKDLVMAIGKPSTPIDFQAIDGRPVTLIWMLSSPPDKTGPHIHALARISRLMIVDKFRASMLAAQTAQEIFDLIVQQENAL